MIAPPLYVGGARVLRWSAIDTRRSAALRAIDGQHRHTGACEQRVAGVLQGPAAGLVIGQYDGEAACYLFGCDPDWGAVTDTYHETLEEAMAQAEFEYEGVSATWNVVVR